MGFNTSIPEILFKKKGYFAGSDLNRAEMVNNKARLYEIGGVREGLVNKWNEMK